MTTLNHAFDEKSLNGLAQKIIKGRYPSINVKYSKHLSELIEAMLKTNPLQRPDMEQILRKAFIKKHVVNFFVDIASRPCTSIGEGTMIVRGAAGGEVDAALNKDSNMIAFQQQLQALHLTPAIAEAMAPKPEPSDLGDAKRVVKEQVGALKREEDHKSMVEAALEKLRLEREARIRERNVAAQASSKGPARPARREEAVPLKAAANRQSARPVPVVPRVSAVEQQRLDREKRASEERRRQQEAEAKERADEKRRVEARAEAKAREDARLQRMREEAEAKARGEKREALVAKERERQRMEIEQLRRDKVELDRRTEEKERVRVVRLAEDRRREDARRELEKAQAMDPRLRADEKDDSLRERQYKQDKHAESGYEFDGRGPPLAMDEIGSRLREVTEGVAPRYACRAIVEC